MVLTTALIGSYPKPESSGLPSLVEDGVCSDKYTIDGYNNVFAALLNDNDSSDLRKTLERATLEVIQKQLDLGIDVLTNGEIARENYIHTFCRSLQGFDFHRPVWKDIRSGAAKMRTISVVSPVKNMSNDSYLSHEWDLSKNIRLPDGKHLKITVPGPLTISDSVEFSKCYENQRSFCADLVSCVNKEVLALVKAGCMHIQIDEPTLVRYPDVSLEYAIDNLKQCFKGVPEDVTKSVHLCCGYPMYLDQTDYEKADPNAYVTLADALEEAGFDEILVEDAHYRNDPSLLSHFKKTKVVLGVINIASSRVESVDEIVEHITDALKYIPKERLVISPDCGLIYLTDDLVKQKVGNMVEAAKQF